MGSFVFGALAVWRRGQEIQFGVWERVILIVKGDMRPAPRSMQRVAGQTTLRRVLGTGWQRGQK